MRFKAHDRYVTAVALHPQKPHLVTGDIDGNIFVWDYHQLTRVAAIRNPDQRTLGISRLAFSPDGTTLACGVTYSLSSGKVELRETNAWSLVQEIECQQVFDLCWSPSGSVLSVASGKILCVDGKNYEVNNTFDGLESWNHCVTFSTSGELLIAGGDFYDPSIAIWNVSSGLLIGQIPDYTKTDPVDELFSPIRFLFTSNSKTILHDQNGIFSFEFQGYELKLLLKPDAFEYVPRLAISPDMRLIAHETVDHWIAIPDWLDKSKNDRWSRPRRAVGVVVSIKDLSSGELIHRIEGFGDSISVMQFLEPNQIIVGDIDGFLTLVEF